MKRFSKVCAILIVFLSQLIAGQKTNGAEVIKVYLLGGQSNMTGYGGYVSQLPSELKTVRTDIPAYVTGTVEASMSGHWVSLQPGLGYSINFFGPEITFGRDLADRQPGEKVAIIKHSVGGTYLNTDWRAPDQNGNNAGPQYINFMNSVANALATLGSQYEPHIVGMIWMQGEADAQTLAPAQAYQQNLINFIQHVRSDLHVPNMKFVAGQISNTLPVNTTYVEVVRQAQYNACQAVGNAITIETNDLPIADNVHFNTQGNITLGRRFAENMLFLQEPISVALVGPNNGQFVDSDGAVLSCDSDGNAISYKLLLGSGPNDMDCLNVVTQSPPAVFLKGFPYSHTWWTIEAENRYGCVLRAQPRSLFTSEIIEININNITHPNTYNLIQDAINNAVSGDEIVVNMGVCQSQENISFNGKNLVIRSTNPLDPYVVNNTIIRGDGTAAVVTFSNNDATCVLKGFTIMGGTKGILSNVSCPVISNCQIMNNSLVGMEASDGKSRVYPVVKNCVIANNGGIGFNIVARSMPTVTNCTITANAGQGLYCAGATRVTLSNSIVWDNAGGSIAADGAIVNASYSDIQGGFTGTENINADPCLASDYHLKSQAGRWASQPSQWVTDSVTSPCIDAGNTVSDWASELWPNGGRINMGAFGGTAQASMSLSNVGNLCDLNGDNEVDFTDFAKFASKYNTTGKLMPEDFDRDGNVNAADVAEFAQNWLWLQ